MSRSSRQALHEESGDISREDVKPIIIESFNILIDDYVAQDEKWKVVAYKKALKALENVKEIHSINDLKGVPGFGKSLTAKVAEIIKTHHLKAADEARDSETTNAIKELMTVHGVGIQKARSLVELGILNVNDLKTEFEKNKELLHEQQALGLKYHNDIHQRIPREEMKQHLEYLRNEITKLSSTARLEVVGSFRRNAENSGDVDVLITDYPDNQALLNDFIEQLKKEQYVIDILSKGPVKMCGLCKLAGSSVARRIDILYTHPYEYPFALLYFTGSGEFNKEMRAHALTLGYSLNQKNIQHKDTSIIVDVEEHNFRNEADIFRFLGLKYIEPPQRNAGNVIKMV